MLDPALPLEFEGDLSSADFRVLITHRREPVAAVLLCILVVAHADQRGLEQSHHDREHLRLGIPATAQIGGDLPAHARKTLTKGQKALILGPVPDLAPERMIAGTASVRAHRVRWLGCGPCRSGISTPLSTLGGSRGCGCGGDFPSLGPFRHAKNDTQSFFRSGPARFPDLRPRRNAALRRMRSLLRVRALS